MISAIRDLGEWTQSYNQKEVLDVLIETIDPKNYPYAVILSFQDDKWEIELEEYDKFSSTKYLYRRGSPNGINYSPTAMITELRKTFTVKFAAWFEKIHKESKEEESKERFSIIKVAEIIAKEKEQILNAVEEKLSGVKEGAFFTVKIDGKYLKQIPVFTDIFLKMVNEKDIQISSSDRMCSVCGEKKSLVMGGSSAFKFYTIDKPGFITGGFDESRSWRNYPVCIECNLLLQEGKRFLEENLRFRFYGLSYLLIPQFLFGKLSLKDDVIDLLSDEEKRKSLKEESVNNTIASEDDILHYLQEESDQLMLHLLFIQKVQAAERILLLVQDVFPSHLRRIFEVKKDVERKFARGDGTLELYNFGRIRTFFQKSDEEKKNADLDKYFLEITAAVFHGSVLDIRFLITFFMKEIRRKFLNNGENEQNVRWAVRDALMNTLFFVQLGNLPKEEGKQMKASRFESVFTEYGPHLNKPEKRALFLLGSLAQLLLDVQKKIRNAQPFAEKLKGLRMRESDFLGLLPEVKEKLRQYEQDNRYEGYERHFASVLGEEISSLLLQAGSGWKLSIDEMNFYFSTGMYLKYNVWTAIKEQRDTNEKQIIELESGELVK